MNDRNAPHESDKQTSHSIPLELDSLQRSATAFHEAGHAIMALVLGRSIEKVTIASAQIQSGGKRLGLCAIQKGRSKSSKDGLEEDVLILMAGMVAEAHFTKQYCEQGAAQDLKLARRLLDQRAATDRQRDRLERRLLDKTEHILADDAHARAIELVARELVEHETISGRAARHLFEQAVKHAN